MDIGLPDVRSWPLLGRRNLLNALLILVVPIPGIAAAWLLFHWFPAGQIPPDPGWGAVSDADGLAAFLLHHPVLSVNVFFFVFCNLLFWAIALVQRSSWLIDPYWTLIPLLLAGFYLAHPMADPNPTRLGMAWIALLLWSARLTYNYFRRESWRCGLREDWRYAKMRRERRFFWLEQFFVVHLAQQGMLVGLTLPLWAISFHPLATGPLDWLLFLASLVGIAIAHFADSQLDRFMRANQERVAGGEARVWLLDSGIWSYSRHPNYFGEQLFWWAIAGLGVVCGEPWVVAGTAFNSAVLASVTVMTERRMLEVSERSEAYAEYQKRTSVLLPWPPR